MSFDTNPLNNDLIGLKDSSAIARSIRNIVFTFKNFFKENIFIKNISEIENYDFKNLVGPVYIEIEVENSSSKNLMRPDKPPVVNKESFVKKIHE